MYQRIASKYIKNKLLEEDTYLRYFVPKYAPYSRDNLKELIGMFSVVFIKEDRSFGAKGILKVEKEDEDIYKVTHPDGHIKKLSLSQFPEWIDPFSIVQQGIVSYGHDGRSLEIRVYLQRLTKARKSKWEVLGVVPKVAPEHTFSPTLERGGTSHKFEEIFEDDLPLLEKIKMVSLRIAESISEKAPGLKELGIDFGLDEEKKLWVFELNTSPSAVTFKPLNRNLYRKIIKNKEILSSTPSLGLNSILTPPPEKKRGCRSCGKTGFRGLKRRG
jgi:hypothetical protein